MTLRFIQIFTCFEKLHVILVKLFKLMRTKKCSSTIKTKHLHDFRVKFDVLNKYHGYLTGRATGLMEKQPKKEVAVAVKALKDEPSKEQKDEFFREVTLMSILRHPNIVQLLAVSTEEEPYGMVFEFMSNGDLNQFLRNALPAETSLDSDNQAKGTTRCTFILLSSAGSGGGKSAKIFFRPFMPQFGQKIRGGGASPRSATPFSPIQWGSL